MLRGQCALHYHGGMTDTLPTPADSIASPEFDESKAQAVDALIVGAGPVGMFAAFQLGLQGVQAHICDSLPQMGGQCIALYADKPIYDIPGIALCTGRELAAQLQRQIQPFHPVFHGHTQVAQLLLHGDGRWRVQLHSMDGPHTTWLLARSVVVTAGVGAFVPKQLRLEGLDAWLGSQVFYHPTLDDEWLAPLLAAHPAPRIVVNGGDEFFVFFRLGERIGVLLIGQGFYLGQLNGEAAFFNGPFSGQTRLV